LECSECKILDAITNLLQWCEIFCPQKDEGTLDHGGDGLVGQNFMVGQILKEFLEEEGKMSTTDGKR
jgi:hypothetical protein